MVEEVSTFGRRWQNICGEEACTLGKSIFSPNKMLVLRVLCTEKTKIKSYRDLILITQI